LHDDQGLPQVLHEPLPQLGPVPVTVGGLFACGASDGDGAAGTTGVAAAGGAGGVETGGAIGGAAVAGWVGAGNTADACLTGDWVAAGGAVFDGGGGSSSGKSPSLDQSTVLAVG
jgi:hypothetical protein